jgi:hypothetical protein
MTFERQENNFRGFEQETQIKKYVLRNAGKYYYVLTAYSR